jgi:hypothetical protein
VSEPGTRFARFCASISAWVPVVAPCAVTTVATKFETSRSWQSRIAPASTPVPGVREMPISAGIVAAVAFETVLI